MGLAKATGHGSQGHEVIVAPANPRRSSYDGGTPRKPMRCQCFNPTVARNPWQSQKVAAGRRAQRGHMCRKAWFCKVSRTTGPTSNRS